MTASKTATVETLIAEVRVLMVGSRQVTLSVYGQLDWTDENIEPFGRVRPRDGDPGWIYIIGRHADTGELVRSGCPSAGYAIRKFIGYSDYLNGWQRHEWQAEKLESEAVRAENRLDQADAPAADPDACRARINEVRNEAAGHRDNAAELRRECDAAMEAEASLAAEWAALPLIVLAGLR